MQWTDNLCYWYGLAAGLGGILFSVSVVRRAPLSLRIPLAIYLAFYTVLVFAGGVVVASDIGFDYWRLIQFQVDHQLLYGSFTFRYWLLLVAPYLIVPVVALWFVKSSTSVTFRYGVLDDVEDPGWLAVLLLALVMVVYCLVNLAKHGYLGVSLLSDEFKGNYQLNIKVRHDMAGTLGLFHFAIIYMGLPALVHFCVWKWRYSARSAWLVVGLLIVGCVVPLYFATLTKSNLLIFGVSLLAGGSLIGLVRKMHFVVAVAAGLSLLMVQEYLLSGQSVFAFLELTNNLLFRSGAVVPFYNALFPEQVPFVGIDVGLQFLGIGEPTISPAVVVTRYMYPTMTAVLGQAPAAAHFNAYAEGGLAWAIFTLVLVGCLIGLAGRLGAGVVTGIRFALYSSLCVAAYYMTQTGFVGILHSSYGIAWTITTLWLLWMVDQVLRYSAARVNRAKSAAPPHVVGRQ